MTFGGDQGSNSGSVLKKLQKLSFEVDLALKQKQKKLGWRASFWDIT